LTDIKKRSVRQQQQKEGQQQLEEPEGKEQAAVMNGGQGQEQLQGHTLGVLAAFQLAASNSSSLATHWWGPPAGNVT
jgi:hypothetical protein